MNYEKLTKIELIELLQNTENSLLRALEVHNKLGYVQGTIETALEKMGHNVEE